MEQYKKVGNLKVRTDLSPEKQALVNQIAQNYVNQNKKIDAEARKGYLRGGLGSVVSGLSFHPIMNIPYVGTGVGGAMYDLGQGIVAGDKAKDLAKRAGRGFVIGETVGAIPYVGKAAAKTKAGQAVVKKLDKVAGKVAQNPAVQKAYDALMTDVRAFNPNKQTAYHGSPYDFNKFSNEAIGTGEGAQAHGLGHYAALNKDVAEEYASRLSKNPLANEEYLNSTELKNLSDSTKQNLGLWDKDFIEQMLKEDLSYSKNWLGEQRLKGKLTPEQESGTLATIDKYQKDLDLLNNFDDSNLISNKQLYKLSIPKDDVMLREGARLDKQPKIVQDAFNQIRQEYLNLEPLEDNKTLLNYFGDKLGNANDFYEKQATEAAIKVLNGGKLSANEWQYLNNLNYEDLHKLDAYFTNGEDILKRLQNHFYDKNNKEQLAQKILYDKGIKGISYNGGIDGEARVIFNPDDIVIGRKYYNQPTLKDIYNKFINSGAIAGAITNP